ncbi:MAG: hypothetical protein H0V56_04100 [Chthoniobacterales bacterium]|nr:hypothetical protein [Chthoniobacterales bacterium]
MSAFDLEVVDGLTLSAELRALLLPGEPVADEEGKVHHLPRFFYAVPSWAKAHETRLTPNFKLAELMTVDCHEAELLLREFPRHVPCAVVLLARYLEDLRRDAETAVFVSANGGYRSPAHTRNLPKSPHCWAAAADIYRVGDTYLNDEKSIAKYREMAERLGPQVFVRPYTEGDDHLHLDLGYVTVTPRDCSERQRI